ncbi:MAG: hypothetical protein JWO67_6679 [Streptosporangiaceae bacterium]|nr:hypothetical protein [Streptosporangiaceae bacterium]
MTRRSAGDSAGEDDAVRPRMILIIDSRFARPRNPAERARRRSGGSVEVGADPVRDLVDLLFGLSQSGLGPRGPLGGAPARTPCDSSAPSTSLCAVWRRSGSLPNTYRFIPVCVPSREKARGRDELPQLNAAVVQPHRDAVGGTATGPRDGLASTTRTTSQSSGSMRTRTGSNAGTTRRGRNACKPEPDSREQFVLVPERRTSFAGG